MNNDELWPYLVKKGGLNYEVMRRIRNEMRDEGVVNKWNDSHNRTLDTLRGVYRDLQ
jgi:predicted transcriptional regulator